jgi:hypothetical protein
MEYISNLLSYEFATTFNFKQGTNKVHPYRGRDHVRIASVSDGLLYDEVFDDTSGDSICGSLDLQVVWETGLASDRNRM